MGAHDAMARYGTLPNDLKQDSTIKTAFKLTLAFANNNFYRVMRKMKDLDAYCALAMHRHLPHMQMHLLEALANANSAKNCRFPIQVLAQLLCPFQSEFKGRLLAWLSELLAASQQEIEELNYVKFNKTTFKVPKVRCSFVNSHNYYCFHRRSPTESGLASTRNSTNSEVRLTLSRSARPSITSATNGEPFV